ncbi:MinD/ParA family ATP-binding protein [Natranaeroarchaeum sulfidigenes]|uniref:FleN family ATPase involved in flagellar biosynthesis n=1 Tax=Natranaeroarchaeum sulfidigenes TaxID=2784880 RepID=A0A897MLS0_9EURY|nr:P-loop NTPase [Natranaeroarchaeum sulfidigenes]QSG01311.1 FleN family ATPase involved in flagellar biosynthesis [Natranaeroarchaeum sulfidigenes]
MILAVTGGKGGVGKSTVALNVAAELDAVVVDADLGMADLPERRGPDLHDVLAGRADPIEAVDESGPVDLLPCGRSLHGLNAADPPRLVEAVETVEREYGRVIVDCPAGMSADAGLPLHVAQRCLLVTCADEFALPDAIRTRALARVLDAGIERLVLNMAGESPPVDRVRSVFGTPVVTIPRSDAVSRAQRTGRPVSTVAPGGGPAAQFESLARALQSE